VRALLHERGTSQYSLKVAITDTYIGIFKMPSVGFLIYSGTMPLLKMFVSALLHAVILTPDPVTSLPSSASSSRRKVSSHQPLLEGRLKSL
jgi:hypothetical protein